MIPWSGLCNRPGGRRSILLMLIRPLPEQRFEKRLTLGAGGREAERKSLPTSAEITIAADARSASAA